MTLMLWILSAGIHIYYVPPFMLHIAALKKPACMCTLPYVDPPVEKDSEEKKAAIVKANAEREYLCTLECPIRLGECPLSQEEGQSDEDYEAACAALADQAKGAESAPADGALTDDEDDEGDYDLDETI